MSNVDKKKEELQSDAGGNAGKSRAQPGQDDLIKKNPNPRANENLPEAVQTDKEDKKQEQGAGSEVTDGEDG
jgi:hypothetical protein